MIVVFLLELDFQTKTPSLLEFRRNWRFDPVITVVHIPWLILAINHEHCMQWDWWCPSRPQELVKINDENNSINLWCQTQKLRLVSRVHPFASNYSSYLQPVTSRSRAVADGADIPFRRPMLMTMPLSSFPSFILPRRPSYRVFDTSPSCSVAGTDDPMRHVRCEVRRPWGTAATADDVPAVISVSRRCMLKRGSKLSNFGRRRCARTVSSQLQQRASHLPTAGGVVVSTVHCSTLLERDVHGWTSKWSTRGGRKKRTFVKQILMVHARGPCRRPRVDVVQSH